MNLIKERKFIILENNKIIIIFLFGVLIIFQEFKYWIVLKLVKFKIQYDIPILIFTGIKIKFIYIKDYLTFLIKQGLNYKINLMNKS